MRGTRGKLPTIALALLVAIVALAGIWAARRLPGAPSFPAAAIDYYAGMDDGAPLAADAVRGRDTWLLWTAGNEAFWDGLAQRSFGAFDLLKLIDSRNRPKRFSEYGLMNEPGFKQADAPDAFGLWLDAPDGTRDPFYSSAYEEAFSRDDFLRSYGRSTGIVGLRLFPNPDFDANARQAWDAQRFYGDPFYYRDSKLVRPYRVGMTCAFCHVGPHPLHPPDDPERPGWQNLSSNVGAQYFRAARIFVLPGHEDSFLFQVVNAMPPGTVDTSALATDNIDNPRSMNAIYQLGARIENASEEVLDGGNLDLPGTQATMKVPHFLKDGADSAGALGALARVYVSIGAFHEEWLKHFNLLVGGQHQTPFPVAKARRESPTFSATLDRLPDVAAFLIAVSRPQPLAKAPDGLRYLQDGEATVARGGQVFAENCAACHSSYSKMPVPPAGVERDTDAWDAWARGPEFKSAMTALVRGPDFLSDNFLSTDRRYPINVIRTNACSALASNALEGHVWDNFSSRTYKGLPAVGKIVVQDPFTGVEKDYEMPGGGRGYQRVASLVSLWASAPYLHNNAVGTFNGDPSVAGRMAAFQDGIEKMLWPEKRLGFGSINRTTATSWLTIQKSYLPDPLFKLLVSLGLGSPDSDEAVRLGPVPKGTPVDLLANLDLELSLDPAKLKSVGELAATLRDIQSAHLDGPEAATRMAGFGPALLKLSKCPDFVTDRGHPFGTRLADDDKRALIAFLKRL